MQNKVVLSNTLVRSVQKLSLQEKRLMMLAISKINGGTDINQLITVTAAEYSEMYGVSRSNVYKTLKIAEDKLWDREFTMGGHRFRWVITCSYNSGEGSISVRFHPDLDDLILGLKSRFTKYFLKRASDFKNIYTWRLFEMLMQFKSTGLLKIDLDDFKAYMEVPVAYNRDFGLIRRKIIDLAVNEIRDKGGLNVRYKTIKTGRKVSQLVFTFPVEIQTNLPLITEDYINKNAKPGESYYQAKKRLSKQFSSINNKPVERE